MHISFALSHDTAAGWFKGWRPEGEHGAIQPVRWTITAQLPGRPMLDATGHVSCEWEQQDMYVRMPSEAPTFKNGTFGIAISFICKGSEFLHPNVAGLGLWSSCSVAELSASFVMEDDIEEGTIIQEFGRPAMNPFLNRNH